MLKLHTNYDCQCHIQSTEKRVFKKRTRKIHRILIVDFRDEVFAMLSSELKDGGLIVDRVEDASEIPNKVIQFDPDLVLVNEVLPEESGWLITRKLRLIRQSLPVWIYTATRWGCNSAWAEMAGAEAIVNYDGDVFCLVTELCQRLQATSGARMSNMRSTNRLANQPSHGLARRTHSLCQHENPHTQDVNRARMNRQIK